MCSSMSFPLLRPFFCLCPFPQCNKRLIQSIVVEESNEWELGGGQHFGNQGPSGLFCHHYFQGPLHPSTMPNPSFFFPWRTVTGTYVSYMARQIWRIVRNKKRNEKNLCPDCLASKNKWNGNQDLWLGTSVCRELKLTMLAFNYSLMAHSITRH